jgi:hypothetical protein
MKNFLKAFAILMVGGFLALGGPRMKGLGFYHEDWTFLGRGHFAAPSFAGRMAALRAAEPRLVYRPLFVPLWAGMYTVFGENALGWHAVILILNTLMAAGAYLVLRRYLVPARIATVWALLFLAYPSKDAAMFWTIIGASQLSLAAFLAAYLAHLEFVRKGRLLMLGVSGAALCVCLGSYDQGLFLPALFLITPSKDASNQARILRGTGLAWGLTAAYLVFKLVILRRIYAIPFELTPVLSPKHFIYVYLAGLNANFGPQLLLAGARAAVHGWRWAPILAAAGCLLPWMSLRTEFGRSEEVDFRPLAVLGIGVFLLSYFPVALSDYSPTPLNHGNRINLVPILGLLMAAAASAPFRGERGRGFLFLRGVTSLALVTHLGFASWWIEGARRIDEVRSSVVAHVSDWPRDTKLFVRLPQRYVEKKVPLFDSPGDISAATWIWTGDHGRQANVVSPRMSFYKDGVVADDAPLLPYAKLRLLDVPRGLILAADEQTFRRLPPALD